MRQIKGRRLEFFDGVVELLQERVQVFLGLRDQVVEDHLDEVVAMVEQTVLQQRTIKDNELFLFVCMFVLHIVEHVIE